MRQRSARIAAAALLLAALTACGSDTEKAGGKDSGTNSSVSGELKTDPATGTRYTGRESDRVVRYGNGYGNTNADKTLKPPTALREGIADPAGTARTAERSTYRQMLENARVHDADGFLLDGENAANDTLW